MADLTGRGNVLNGQVRSSGLVLFEDGRAGTAQQIDLGGMTGADQR